MTAALPKGGQKQHQRALPHREVAAALETARRSNAQMSTKLAFEFLVLTAARSGEIRLMTWEEVDTEDRLWTVPGSRKKAGREHRVPVVSAQGDMSLREEAGENDDDRAPAMLIDLVNKARGSLVIHDDGNDSAESVYNNDGVVATIRVRIRQRRRVIRPYLGALRAQPVER